MKFSVFLSIALLSSTAFAETAPSMGNTTEVITEVSAALQNDGQDEKIKKEAKKTEQMAKDDKECPPEEKSADTAKSKSPNDEAEEQHRKKVKLFFNMQFMVTGKNGEPSFASTEVPWINYRDEIGNYALKNKMSRAQVLAFGDDRIKEILRGGTSLTGQAKEDAVANAMLVKKLSGMSGDNMYKTLEVEMSKASYARKVNFLANFLSYLYENYDDDAESGENNADAPVSDEMMMKSINLSIQSGNVVPAGVCRHMHQLAVRYAHAMGIKEAFGVGFRTISSGHRTLVLTSPDDPSKVVQLDYGSKLEMTGVSGPDALSQNHTRPNTGIKFRIFNGRDEHAINLPSEQGAILNRMTGGEDSDLAPDYKSQAQIKQIGIATPYGTVRFFHAATPMGNQTQMTGDSYNVKVKYSDVFYGEYGIAGFHSERPVHHVNLKTSGLYIRTTQGFNYTFYAADNVNLTAFGKLHAKGAYYCSSVRNEDCQINRDSQIDVVLGGVARYQTGPIEHRTGFIVQLQPEGSHATKAKEVGISAPVMKLSHDTDFKIASDIYGNVGGGVTMYNLGTGTYWTYNGKGGIDSRRTGTYFGVEANGRLTDRTPFWIPGAEHSVDGVVNQSIFGNKLYIGMQGKQSFDVMENSYFGLNLGGKF